MKAGGCKEECKGWKIKGVGLKRRRGSGFQMTSAAPHFDFHRVSVRYLNFGFKLLYFSKR